MRNLNLKHTLATVLLLTAPAAFAQGGGVHGGGQILDVDGTPELMDLVKGATCDWRTGTDVYQENPKAEALLNELSKLDWYFADSIKREIKSLMYCFTGELYRISPVDPDSPVAIGYQINSRYVQAAVRMNRTVFINEEEFSKIKDPNRKGLLLIHEAMHSFLDMRTPQRSLRMRTMVKDIFLISAQKITTRKQLHVEMKNNDIAFPRTTDALDQYRPQVEFLTAESPDQTAIVLTSPQPEKLYASINDFFPNLAWWDQGRVNQIGAKQMVINAMVDIFKNGSEDDFKATLQKQYVEISPTLVAISVLDQLSPVKQAIIFDSGTYRDAILKSYQNIEALDVIQGEYRILASPELSRLFGSGSDLEGAPLTSVSLEVTPNLDLKILVQIVAASIRAEKWGQIVSLVTNNDEFYRALGLKIQTAKINAMPVDPNRPIAIPREKPLAIKVLKEMQSALVEAFLSSIENKVSKKQFEQFKAAIQMSRFEN